MDAKPEATPSPRARRPRWLEHLLVAAVAIAVALARCLPLSLLRWAARIFGGLVYFIGGPRFMGVERNLRIALGPDLDADRTRALARAFWIHFAQSLAEAIKLSSWTADNCNQHLEIPELELFTKFRARKGGVIVVSGHVGSWETAPYAMALLGYPIQLLHNPGTVAPLFEYLRRQRERSGMKILSRLAHPWTLKKALDRGAWLVIAADLNAGRRAEFVPFFGIQASTYLTPAALQQATGAPILVITTARQPNGLHRIRIWKVIEAQRTADARADLQRTMREVHAGLEEAIRTHPEQWLWIYRRWRSRPAGEVHGPDGLPPRVETPSRIHE